MLFRSLSLSFCLWFSLSPSTGVCLSSCLSIPLSFSQCGLGFRLSDGSYRLSILLCLSLSLSLSLSLLPCDTRTVRAQPLVMAVVSKTQCMASGFDYVVCVVCVLAWYSPGSGPQEVDLGMRTSLAALPEERASAQVRFKTRVMGLMGRERLSGPSRRKLVSQRRGKNTFLVSSVFYYLLWIRTLHRLKIFNRACALERTHAGARVHTRVCEGGPVMG